MKIGLALSGGGFRATLYSVGSLLRLNELGMLPKIDTITSVSGGAIAAGYLAYKWDVLDFDPTTGIASNFTDEFVTPLIQFCENTIDIPSGLIGLFSPFHTIGDKVSQAYDKHLFKQKLIKDVAQKPNAPEFVFYGTNYDTGVSVQITKEYLYDYRIGNATNHNILLSKAVGISSAFPPFFSPIVLDGSNWKWEKTSYADLFESKSLKQNIMLCDGGLYDNMGIEKLWKTGEHRKYKTVFVCDSGAPLETPYKYANSAMGKLKKFIRWRKNWGSQFMRMSDIMINQQRALRKRQLINVYGLESEYDGTYWGIDVNIEKYPNIKPLVNYDDTYKSMAMLPTQLRPFSANDRDTLINWSYALTDAALRSRFDGSLTPASKLPR